MSSADFLNFGTAALNIAGTAYVAGQATKLLREAEKTVRPTRREIRVVKKVRGQVRKASHKVQRHESILGERFDLRLNL